MARKFKNTVRYIDVLFRSIFNCFDADVYQMLAHIIQFSHCFETRFTRDLDVTRNTHLVACKPEGAKYDAACAANNMQLSSRRQSKEAHLIQIVKGSWLESCEESLKRVKEGPHRFDNKLVANTNTTCESAPIVSLIDSLNEQLEPGTSRAGDIFATCNFFLVGFDEEADPVNLTLGRLIRRGLGTIFWEFHEGITHVIVHDHASEAIE